MPVRQLLMHLEPSNWRCCAHLIPSKNNRVHGARFNCMAPPDQPGSKDERLFLWSRSDSVCPTRANHELTTSARQSSYGVLLRIYGVISIRRDHEHFSRRTDCPC